jgi:phage terminase small subunit
MVKREKQKDPRTGLTPKREAFAKAFVETNNASEAYRRSFDVRPTTKLTTINEAACRLLADSKVAARVAELQAAVAEKHGITISRIVGELAKLGFSNMEDYMKIGDDGVPRLDFKSMSRDKAAAISEMTVEEFTARGEAQGGKEGLGVRKVRFKLHDKRAALVDLGKHLGMFKDIVEHTGKNGGPIETAVVNDVEAARRIAYALGKAIGKRQASTDADNEEAKEEA